MTLKLVLHYDVHRILGNAAGVCAAVGIFERDPDLQEFVISKPAQVGSNLNVVARVTMQRTSVSFSGYVRVAPDEVAGHQLQWAFERMHSESDCRTVITEYTRCGGDNGMTEKHLRKACRLPPVINRDSTPVGVVEAGCSQEETAIVDEDTKLRAAAKHFTREYTTRGWNLFTQGYFNQVPWPDNLHLSMKRAALWNMFKESNLWISLGSRGKTKDAIIPRISTRLPYGALFASMPIEGVTNFDDFKHRSEGKLEVFPEECDLSKFQDVFHGNRFRKANVEVLREALCSGKKKRGKKTQDQDHHAERASKLAAMESLIDDITEMCGDTKTPSKKRRLLRKSSGTHIVSSEVAYHYNHDWRCRRYARSPMSAQHMDRRLQRVLLNLTHDLDLENCLFSLALQMIERLDIVDKDFWAEELLTLEELATKRAEVCRVELDLPKTLGKLLLHQVFNGAAIPHAYEKNAYLMKVTRLGRFMRCLSVSLMPDVHSILSTSSDTRWPEASCFSFMWQAVEDGLAVCP